MQRAGRGIIEGGIKMPDKERHHAESAILLRAIGQGIKNWPYPARIGKQDDKWCKYGCPGDLCHCVDDAQSEEPIGMRQGLRW